MELTNEQIDRRLVELPHEFWENAEKERKARNIFKKEQLGVDNQFHGVYLQLKATKPKATIKELEAEANMGVYEQKLAVLLKESEYEKCKLKTQETQMKFSALQSTIKLRVAEMQTIQGGRT